MADPTRETTSGNGRNERLSLGQAVVRMSEGIQCFEEAAEAVDQARCEVASGAAYLATLLHDLGTRDRPTGVEICLTLARLAGNESTVERTLAGN